MKPFGSVAFDAIGRTFEGSISAIARPDTAQMAAYTAQVRRNSPYTPESLRRAPLPSGSVIPARVGDPCPIKYVLYIIKENRTYDLQVALGDLRDAAGRPLGNGDPDLAIFGETVTPNHHQLARDYVLLDNLYSNSEVSVDGHSWCDAAIATDFNQRSWISVTPDTAGCRATRRWKTPPAATSGTSAGATASASAITARGRSASPRCIAAVGRRAGRRPATWSWWTTGLRTCARRRKPASCRGSPSCRWARITLTEPGLGLFSPNACVGSNDVGLGKIVAAATRSRFWKEMAIFVIEDDTQNGPDHVDAHRTVGFVISPYAKRGYVDSTLYTTASMIRTMELILGLPPLTQYDAAATPMFACFQREPVLTPYGVRQPQCDLQERNTTKSAFWEESSRMDSSEYDRAPEDELNRILWRVARGDAPYPVPIHRAVFTR